jgi:hypothetical protein
MVTFGITEIFSSMVELFGVIYNTAYMLYAFFTTPLVNSAGGSEQLLGDLANFTPFELMFGPGIILALVFAVVGFVMKLSPL